MCPSVPPTDHACEKALETYLLFCETRAHPNNIHDVALHHPDVRQVAPIQRIKLLALALPLLLLLSETFMAIRNKTKGFG